MYEYCCYRRYTNGREKISELICKYGGERGVSLNVTVFLSAEEFFKNAYEKFSAVFTDIMMPGVSGMDLARKIRKADSEIPIVFISAEKEYALEGYEVQAFDYILKPINPERLGKIIDRLLKLKSANEKVITIKLNRRDVDIPVNKIIYAEARNHNVDIYTTEGKHSVYMTFKNMIDLFSVYPQFIT
ncbi:MAG: LytTR family DNA-binding domain-containing protein, partial [Clostridiales bacterium]|nr:LytTR family DNA-binding domain-containing protein [Clostridiales bacterium]